MLAAEGFVYIKDVEICSQELGLLQNRSGVRALPAVPKRGNVTRTVLRQNTVQGRYLPKGKVLTRPIFERQWERGSRNSPLGRVQLLKCTRSPTLLTHQGMQRFA